MHTRIFMEIITSFLSNRLETSINVGSNIYAKTRRRNCHKSWEISLERNETWKIAASGGCICTGVGHGSPPSEICIECAVNARTPRDKGVGINRPRGGNYARVFSRWGDDSAGNSTGTIFENISIGERLYNEDRKIIHARIESWKNEEEKLYLRNLGKRASLISNK